MRRGISTPGSKERGFLRGPGSIFRVGVWSVMALSVATYIASQVSRVVDDNPEEMTDDTSTSHPERQSVDESTTFARSALVNEGTYDEVPEEPAKVSSGNDLPPLNADTFDPNVKIRQMVQEMGVDLALLEDFASMFAPGIEESDVSYITDSVNAALADGRSIGDVLDGLSDSDRAEYLLGLDDPNMIEEIFRYILDRYGADPSFLESVSFIALFDNPNFPSDLVDEALENCNWVSCRYILAHSAVNPDRLSWDRLNSSIAAYLAAVDRRRLARSEDPPRDLDLDDLQRGLALSQEILGILSNPSLPTETLDQFILYLAMNDTEPFFPNEYKFAEMMDAIVSHPLSYDSQIRLYRILLSFSQEFETRTYRQILVYSSDISLLRTLLQIETEPAMQQKILDQISNL